MGESVSFSLLNGTYSPLYIRNIHMPLQSRLFCLLFASSLKSTLFLSKFYRRATSYDDVIANDSNEWICTYVHIWLFFFSFAAHSACALTAWWNLWLSAFDCDNFFLHSFCGNHSLFFFFFSHYSQFTDIYIGCMAHTTQRQYKLNAVVSAMDFFNANAILIVVWRCSLLWLSIYRIHGSFAHFFYSHFALL